MTEDLVQRLRDAAALPTGLYAEAADEIERLTHNVGVLTDAIFKACGDDEDMVRQTIESQGELRPARPALRERLKCTP